MIQTSPLWRARAACELCGGGPWTWRVSSVSVEAAMEKAEADLADHVSFWHRDGR